MGHLTQIVNGAGTTNFTYEGTGQLSHVSGPNGDIDLYHDIDDGLTMRVHGDAVEYWFSGWQLDDNADSPREIEQVLPMVQQVTDTATDVVSFRWIAREYDGHGLLTFGHDGAVVGAELLGAYGVQIAERANDASLALNGFHGMEQDEGFAGTRMGVRHMLPDGRWMQAEPLLWMGLPSADSPRHWMGTYSAANPIDLSDRSGYSTKEAPSLEEVLKQYEDELESVRATTPEERELLEQRVLELTELVAVPDLVGKEGVGADDAIIEGAFVRALAATLPFVGPKVRRWWMDRKAWKAARAKGLKGEQVAEDLIKGRGHTIRGDQITFLGSNNVRSRPDFVVERPDGSLYVLEVKNGPGARVSTNQYLVFSEIADGSAVPVGGNAARGGLTPGQTLGPIDVEIIHMDVDP